MKKMGTLLALVLLISCTAYADIAWDVLDQNFGNGTGQISARSTLMWLFSYGTPNEVLYDGYSNLTPITAPDYGGYTYTGASFTMPSDGTWTLQFTIATLTGSKTNISLGDGSKTWSSMLCVNAVYKTEQEDALSDYSRRDAAVNIAPVGFDSAQMNTYTFAAGDGKLKLYVNDVYVADLLNGVGGVADNTPFNFNLAGEANVASLKISNETYVPEPTTVAVMFAGLIGIVRRIKK